MPASVAIPDSRRTAPASPWSGVRSGGRSPGRLPPAGGVGDKAGSQRVRGVGEGVDAGALDRSLHEVVDGLGAEAASDDPAAGGNGPEDGAGADDGHLGLSAQRPHGQWPALGPMGRTTSSGSALSWLVLERGMVTTRPWGWSFTSSKSRATSSDSRSAPTNPTSNRALSALGEQRNEKRRHSGSVVAVCNSPPAAEPPAGLVIRSQRWPPAQDKLG